MVVELVVFVLIVVVVGVAGIRLGMLLAPRLGRIADSLDEDERGDGD